MSLRGFDAFFAPRSIALIGPSERQGSVGRAVAANLFGAGFDGPILPVHPRLESLHGAPVYRDVASLPIAPDLAVIATPAATVPAIVRQLADRGARAVVILSAGFRERGPEGAALERAVLDAARPRGMRVMGPNCIGFMAPARGVNASFAHLTPRAGDLAFVSQSGAMVAAMLDWAADRSVGFSRAVSLGNMIDVDLGDLLDDLALDRDTRAILLYVEAIASARKFMSAARAAARRKPVLVIKAGSVAEAARAARAHTGAGANEGEGPPPSARATSLATSDAVYEAAFRRAGMLRVHTMAELFDGAETLARSRVPAGNRLAILTNGGGPGVLATDSLITQGGVLAELRPQTRERLEAKLGSAWSRDNPVDILADARGERYAAALEALLADRGADAVLVLQAPTSLAPSLEAAEAIATAAHEPRVPVLACFMGGASGEPARRWLVEHGVPSYETPEAATRAFLHLVEYRRNRTELQETPPSVALDVPSCDRDAARIAIDRALAAGREWLLDDEAAAVLAAYGVPMATAPADSAASIALAIGLFSDATFGPILFCGAGRSSIDLAGDRALALPPLNFALARHVLERARIGALLTSRDPSGAAFDAVASTLVRISQIAIDQGAVVELEVDPLQVGPAGVMAGAARVRVAPGLPPGEERLAIRPYPRELEGSIELRDGHRLPIRPIRPEDEPRLQEAFRRLTPEDVRLRFFSPLRVLHHDLAAQLAQIDYDRAMAFVVLEEPSDDGSNIVGVARLTADPDRERAEYAVTVRSDWKGRGLGHALMRKMIDYARSKDIRELFGYVLRENETMLAMSRELGFTVTGSDEGPGVVRVSLALTAAPSQPL
ncbi:MAG TPA: GNAT family N-acetyltransferase [Thermoanaerobaculia bacterium]|nr:GNAT family N-acetyltransferase [Thermoanaerobaculia bacterium]